MKDAIEIYTKVIVAFFGFVAPSFTILISLFLDGIEKKRLAYEERSKELGRMSRELVTKSPDAQLSKIIAETSTLYKTEEKKAKKARNLLNPKRQVIRLFIPLVLSLFCISLYHCCRCVANYNRNDNKLILLLFSAAFFCYSIYVLWQLFEIIIDIKKSIVEEKNTETLTRDEDGINSTNTEQNERI